MPYSSDSQFLGISTVTVRRPSFCRMITDIFFFNSRSCINVGYFKLFQEFIRLPEGFFLADMIGFLIAFAEGIALKIRIVYTFKILFRVTCVCISYNIGGNSSLFGLLSSLIQLIPFSTGQQKPVFIPGITRPSLIPYSLLLKNLSELPYVFESVTERLI